MVNAKYYKRIYGWLIDELISLLFGVACIFLTFYFNPSFSLFFAVTIAIFVDYFFYVLLTSTIMYLNNGSSFGMMLQKIKTADINGNSLKYKACFLKCFLNGIIVVTIVNAIFMVCVHTERSLFDRLTETIAIEKYQ